MVLGVGLRDRVVRAEAADDRHLVHDAQLKICWFSVTMPSPAQIGNIASAPEARTCWRYGVKSVVSSGA